MILKETRWLATLALLLSLLAGLAIAAALPEPAAAAETATQLKVNQLDVQVWPEYDDPRILVILQPTLADDVKLPVKVSYLLPKDKNLNINMACELVNGQHQCKPTEIVDKGKYQEVSYTASTARTLFFEYYYDGFAAAGKGGQKQFTYEYIPTFASIGQMNVSIQQPLRTKEFKVSPSSSNTTTDDKGFTYYMYNFPGVKAGTPVAFQASYSKTDSEPSVEKNAAEGEGSKVGGVNVRQLVPLLAVLAIIGIIIYWMMPGSQRRGALATAGGSSGRGESGRSASAKGASGRGSKKANAKVKTASKSRGAAFCSNCGAAARRGDNFCTECGQTLGA